MSGKASLVGLVTGLLLTGGLLVWSGLDQVLEILKAAGWSLLLVMLLAPPEALLASEAWRSLFPTDRKPRVWLALRGVLDGHGG